MLKTFGLKIVVLGTMMAAFMPATGFARDRHGRDGRSFQRQGFQSGHFYSRGPAVRGFVGGGRAYIGGRGYGGGRGFVTVRPYVGGRALVGRGYYGRGYVAPRFYRRPGYYRGGVFLGLTLPYGYTYGPGYTYVPDYGYSSGYAVDPGYAYDQGQGSYSEDVCSEAGYDSNGNWVGDPNCNQQQYEQYPQDQQNYDPGPNYNNEPSQRNYPPNGQYYDPNEPRQRYNR